MWMSVRCALSLDRTNLIVAQKISQSIEVARVMWLRLRCSAGSLVARTPSFFARTRDTVVKDHYSVLLMIV